MADEVATVVTEPVVADTTPADSTPAEETKSEVAPEETHEKGEYTAADVKEESAPAPSEPAAEEPEAPAEPQGEEKPLAPKSQNRFQKVVNERNDLQRQLDEIKAREAQTAQEQELLGEVNPETGDYYTPQEVERIAFQQAREKQQQSLAQQRYDLEVQQNQQTIQSEAQKVLQDFPMFDESSPEFDAELAAEADQLLGQSLITDETGNIVGANQSPYKIYKAIALASQRAAAKGQAKAQKATEKMLANADNSGSSQRGEKPFEKLSLAEMKADLRKKGHDI